MVAKTALITGANRGIGRLLAVALADAGLEVVVLGRSAEALEPVVAEIEARGRRSVPVVADVTDSDSVDAAVRVALDQLGSLDVLINNAGVIDAVEVPIWQTDPTDFRRVVETDLLGPFHLIRAGVPGMIARGGGRVINLNSNAGAQDRAIYPAYCAAKAGLFRLSGNLHLSGFGQGLRAFEISPGHILTKMTASMPLHAGRTEWVDPVLLADLVVAAAQGQLDAWSGCYLVAGVDAPESLHAAEALQVEGARRLAIRPFGDGDPLAG